MRRLLLTLLSAPALLLAGCGDGAPDPAPGPAPSGTPEQHAPASPSPTASPSATPSDQPPPDHTPPPEDAAPLPEAPTIYDPDMAARLRANKGLTLQWIDWDRRGTATVHVGDDGAWHLTGRQRSATGQGLLMLDGVVTEIGRDYFVFDGKITITDTPDLGRMCSANKVWQFGITQRRSYWRLREFEWCDELTDYIDIYF